MLGDVPKPRATLSKARNSHDVSSALKVCLETIPGDCKEGLWAKKKGGANSEAPHCVSLVSSRGRGSIHGAGRNSEKCHRRGCRPSGLFPDHARPVVHVQGELQLFPSPPQPAFRGLEVAL